MGLVSPSESGFGDNKACKSALPQCLAHHTRYINNVVYTQEPEESDSTLILEPNSPLRLWGFRAGAAWAKRAEEREGTGWSGPALSISAETLGPASSSFRRISLCPSWGEGPLALRCTWPRCGFRLCAGTWVPGPRLRDSAAGSTFLVDPGSFSAKESGAQGLRTGLWGARFSSLCVLLQFQANSLRRTFPSAPSPTGPPSQPHARIPRSLLRNPHLPYNYPLQVWGNGGDFQRCPPPTVSTAPSVEWCFPLGPLEAEQKKRLRKKKKEPVNWL